MSKITEKETKDLAVVTEAVSVMAMLPTAESVEDGFKEPTGNLYLPNLQFIYPIMVTPETPEWKGREWHLVFKNGVATEVLPKGTIITLLDKRNSARVKSKDDKGVSKNDYFYDQVVRGPANALQTFNATTAGYNDAVKREAGDDNVDTGYSFVLVALFPDNREVVLEFGAYKILPGYFYPCMGKTMLASGMGVRIDVEDHTCNLKKSKAERFYPDVAKFKQYEHIQLSKEQLTRAVAAVNASAAQYEQWLKR